jgi:hypothetical protein
MEPDADPENHVREHEYDDGLLHHKAHAAEAPLFARRAALRLPQLQHAQAENRRQVVADHLVVCERHALLSEGKASVVLAWIDIKGESLGELLPVAVCILIS